MRIEMQAVTAGYDQRKVLQEVDLKLPEGKVTVIVGSNGCGKSTLLKTLAGILPCRSGKVWLGEVPLEDLEPRRRARQIAYLTQSRDVPEITVERLVLHGRFPYLSYPRRYRREDLEIARRAMEQIGIHELADQPLRSLSGGTRQKVYIAMALAQDTPVILMDEPTTFLDVSHQLQTLQQARELAAAGKTVVLVLHDLSLALQLADYLVVMQDGKIQRQGDPEEVYHTGCLENVFGVRINRFRTEDGWKYYYMSPDQTYNTP